MKSLIAYARTFIGVPYRWGGETPMDGLDCSGLSRLILDFAGVSPISDQNAQGLYNHFVGIGHSPDPGPGCLVFYGENTKSITHVSLMTSPYTVIEAAGGSSKMTGPKALEIAIKNKAFVKERPLNRRKDIVAIVMPNYPDWVKEI